MELDTSPGLAIWQIVTGDCARFFEVPVDIGISETVQPYKELNSKNGAPTENSGRRNLYLYI